MIHCEVCVHFFIIILRFLRWQSLGIGARLIGGLEEPLTLKYLQVQDGQHLALTVCNV